VEKVQSPVTALASADLRHEVAAGLLHLPRLSLSRRVSCTNACTNRPLGLLVRVGKHGRPIWHTTATGVSDPQISAARPASTLESIPAGQGVATVHSACPGLVLSSQSVRRL
jgi:hypothetical protein